MRSEIYEVYSNAYDMTFIMEDVYNCENLISTEVKGFYYGEPNDQATLNFNGCIKANYEEV